MAAQSKAGLWYLIAVGVSLCLISGVFLWLMIRSYLRAQEMSTWPQVPCLILRSEVGEKRIAENVAPDYRFVLLFRYEFGGEDYESDRWGLRGSPPRKSREQVEETVAHYPAGSWHRCWVNPQQPELALLQLDSRAAGYSLWFPALFLIGGLGMIVGAGKRLRGE
jgi:hypothetical protein